MKKQLFGAALASHQAKLRGRKLPLRGAALRSHRFAQEIGSANELMMIGDQVVLSLDASNAEKPDGRVPWDGDVLLDENFDVTEEEVNANLAVEADFEAIDEKIDGRRALTPKPLRCVVLDGDLQMDVLMWAELHEPEIEAAEDALEEDGLEAGLQMLAAGDEAYEEMVATRRRRTNEVLDLAASLGCHKAAVLRGELRSAHKSPDKKTHATESVRKRRKHDARQARASKHTVDHAEQVAALLGERLAAERDLSEAEETFEQARDALLDKQRRFEKADERLNRLVPMPGNIERWRERILTAAPDDPLLQPRRVQA